MASSAQPVTSDTADIDRERVEYQSRTGPLCLNPPPENLSGFSHCVKPQGHTDRFCQFEHRVDTTFRHTDVVFDSNPAWDGTDPDDSSDPADGPGDVSNRG